MGLTNWIAGLAVLGSVVAQTIPYASHCETTPNGQVCYAVNIPNDSANSQNAYISITGPSKAGYVGMGFGNQMAGSLFFIAMPATNNVTLSVRTTSAEVMPMAYTATQITTETLPGTAISNGQFQLNFKCIGCRTWSTGSLDTTSSSTGFIWSSGSLGSGASPTDKNAVILYHGDVNGNFALNLQTATGTGGVPGSGTASASGSAASGSAVASRTASASSTSATVNAFAANAATTSSETDMDDHDNLWWSHAVFMALGWILIIGLGAIVVRFVPIESRVRLHYMLQDLGVVFVIIGLGLGVAGSEYHFKYAHQTVGVVLFILVFIQALGGTLHHVRYVNAVKKGTSLPSSISISGKGHRYFGRALIVTAIVNVGLAFRMPMVGLGKGSQIAWYVVMGAVVLAYTIANLVVGRDQRLQETSKHDQHLREKNLPESEHSNASQ